MLGPSWSFPGSGATPRPYRLAERPYDQCAKKGSVTKANFKFGGVDIHIHFVDATNDEHYDHREAAARKHISIGGFYGAHDQPVAHRPTVDNHDLHIGMGAVMDRQAGETPQVKGATGEVK